MLFSKLIVATAAFAIAQAAVEFTNPTFSTITAGKPFNLTWSGADGPVTLTLKDGPSTALVTVNTIASKFFASDSGDACASLTLRTRWFNRHVIPVERPRYPRSKHLRHSN